MTQTERYASATSAKLPVLFKGDLEFGPQMDDLIKGAVWFSFLPQGWKKRQDLFRLC